jgi:hypothetical protein
VDRSQAGEQQSRPAALHLEATSRDDGSPNSSPLDSSHRFGSSTQILCSGFHHRELVVVKPYCHQKLTE